MNIKLLDFYLKAVYNTIIMTVGVMQYYRQLLIIKSFVDIYIMEKLLNA